MVIAEILQDRFQLPPELLGALIVFTLVNTLLPASVTFQLVQAPRSGVQVAASARSVRRLASSGGADAHCPTRCESRRATKSSPSRAQPHRADPGVRAARPESGRVATAPRFNRVALADCRQEHLGSGNLDHNIVTIPNNKDDPRPERGSPTAIRLRAPCRRRCWPDAGPFGPQSARALRKGRLLSPVGTKFTPCTVAR
jgi:hypothetical protein